MMRFIKVLLLILPLSVNAQEVLTLDRAIELALDNNYGIKIARSNQEIADNNYTLGNAGFLPQVTLNINQNNTLVNGDQTRGTNPTEEVNNKTNRSLLAGGNLNWTLFDGTRMFVNYDLLESQNLQSLSALEFSIETVIYNVSTNFFLASLEKERLTLLKSNLGLSDDRLKIAKDKYELGKGSKLEFLQAQVDYNTDQSNILNQEQLLAIQKLELLRQIGIRDSSDFSLSYILELNTDITLDYLLNSITNNKDLDVFERAKEIAELQEQVSRSDRLPTLSVFAGYNYSDRQNAVGFSFESTTTDLSYGFNANFTLFNGFNIDRIIQNNKINKDIADYAYQQRLLDIETSIKQQYLSYLNSIELLKLEEQNVLVAKENNDIAKERYDIGLSNPVEYRESQVNLIAAESRKQNAQFAAKIAEIELKYLAGISIR